VSRASLDSHPEGWSARSQEGWASDLGVPLLEIHPVITSTNERLIELAGRGAAPPFATVVAGAQTRGRGRGGKEWRSPEGGGLWLSCLVPLGPKGTPGVLPLAVGVSVARAVERLRGIRVELKWPNDVLLDGRKLAGVLCEAVGDPTHSVVVGVGINLRPSGEVLSSELPWGAAFLEEAGTGPPISAPTLARALITEVRDWADPPPLRLEGRLRAEWEARDFLRSRAIRVDGGGSGTVEGVSDRGRLSVRGADGRRFEVVSGTIHLDRGSGEGEGGRSTHVTGEV
jgi:BirA family transcriptional regulator, biotin operon repressor / biotin---[acetyl-CoA-carboxylase] ligase